MEDQITSRLMGMMAVEKGLISEKQLRALLNAVEIENRPMMEVALEREFLTSAQVDKLRRLVQRDVREIQPTTYTKKKLALLAVESQVCTKAQVKECLVEQREFASLGAHFALGQLLMSKGYVKPNQVTRILAQQGKRFLQCTDFCDGCDTVRNYSDENFYRCPKCGSDLEPAELVPISRTSIEEKVELMRGKDESGIKPLEKRAPRREIKIDLSTVELDAADSDFDMDSDLGDLDVLKL